MQIFDQKIKGNNIGLLLFLILYLYEVTQITCKGIYFYINFVKKPIKDILPRGCPAISGRSGILPKKIGTGKTKEGYKRTAGYKADIKSSADSP